MERRASSAGRLFASLATGLAITLAAVAPASARQSANEPLGTIAAQQMPNEAQDTLRQIESGGPFPYDKDGSRFGNYERSLPRQARDYYREYTVKTARSRNRGARRIVCGGDQRAANDCYYTDDHYNSFKRIAK
jgi:ribonuclease T1